MYQLDSTPMILEEKYDYADSVGRLSSVKRSVESRDSRAATREHGHGLFATDDKLSALPISKAINAL